MSKISTLTNPKENLAKITTKISAFFSNKNNLHTCYIPSKRGFISNFFLKKIFSRVTINTNLESLKKEIDDDSIIIYASKNRSFFEYLFFNIRFQDEILPNPEIGMEYSTYFWQPLRRIFKIYISQLNFFLRNFKLPNPYKSDYIKEELLKNKAAFIPLVGKKAFYKRFIESKTDAIKYLIELQKSTDRKVYIIPEIITYNLKPRKTKVSIYSILFGTVDDPGKIRRLLGMVKNKKNTFVELSEPVCIKDFINQPKFKHLDEKHLSIVLRKHLINEINTQTQSIKGPVHKSRDEIKESILTEDCLEEFMKTHAEEENLTIQEVHKKADSYVDEIQSNYSQWWINLYYIVLTWMFKNIFEGIVIDDKGLRKVKEASKKAPLIMVPCHKSHLDYLILSYVMYTNNMPCPHIAAGKNLSFFPLGTIFRGGGAFFLRRTFKGVPLYSKVFSAYVEKLILEGFNIEFFIEGGRSRTGKLLSPKIGLLSIIIDAFKKGICDDLIFVPISFSYDRVLEEGSYLHEIEGGNKTDESVGQILKARKLISKRYGKVFVNFDEPISFNNYMKEKNLNISDIKEEDTKELCMGLGYNFLDSINSILVVTPHGIVASALLNSSKTHPTFEMLKTQMFSYINYLKSQNVIFSETLQADTENSLKKALDIYEQRKYIERVKNEIDDEKSEIIYNIHENRRPGLDYYKNNCINHFIPASVTAIAIFSHDAFDFKVSDLTETYNFIREFFIDEFPYDLKINHETVIRKIIKFFIDESIIIPHDKTPDTYNLTASGFRKLHIYSRFLKPYLESYLVALTYFSKHKQKTQESKNQLKKVHNLGNKMYKKKEIERHEAVSRITFKNAIKCFNKLDINGSEDKEKIKLYKGKIQAYINYIS